MSGSTYYQLNWVADAGVNYTLQSLDAKLMLAGGKFYDLATATPYNPASGSLKGAEYTLTALDGTKYELDAERGLVGQIAANGTKLIYSDAGIIPNTPSPTPNTPSPESVRFVKDSAGNITQITAPNGTQLSYEYDSIGNLVSVRNSATGEALKYGYKMGTITPHSSSSRLTVISNSTGGAVINDDATTTQITRDLGGIANFNGKSIIPTNDARQIYSFNLKPTELNTTNNQTILIGVEGAGDVLINGTAPVSTQDNYRVFAVDKAGINLLEITNPGATFKLSLVGDLNSDNRVDGIDTQLLTSNNIDLNRDGVSNVLDLQLLGGNYGLVGNNAPVITPIVGLTHVDLSTRIDLSKLATDIEGDLIAFSVKSGVSGKVEISADGKYAIYTPESGFGGTGGFELIASDGFSSSQANIDVNVSTAALVNLDIINRNPKLQVGDKYLLQLVGDFADQYGVDLPAEYVNFAVNSPVVTVDSHGTISALVDGTGVISAVRNGVSAFTATRVGTFNPTTALDSLIKDGESNGLNAYPGLVTLIPGMQRQVLVSTFSAPQNPNSLTDNNTGTNYYIGNPNILEVNSSGLITAKQTGITTVTVINQGAEAVLFIQVGLPSAQNSQVGITGGAIQTTDGSLVTIAPGSLAQDTPISIEQITPAQVSLTVPPDYQVVGAFKLNLGDTPLTTAAQIAIPASTGLASGTEVFFLQKGELPNEQGVMQPIWLLRESGKVDDDGMIRTSSPPWEGVKSTGEYTIVVPTFNYSRVDVEANITKIATLYTGAVTLALLSAGLGVIYSPSIPLINFQLSYLSYTAKASLKLKLPQLLYDGQNTSDVKNGSLNILAHIPTLLNNVIPKPQVSLLTIPTYGLPYQTTANIELNPGQIPTAKIDIVPRASGEYQPEISSVELKIEDFNGSVAPLLTLTGENFGQDLSALKVDLISATGEIINLPIITSLSAFSRLVVQPSNLLPINSQSQLQITRTYQTAYQPNPTQFKSELVDLPDEPLYRDVSLVPLTWDNKIAVYNTTNPQSVIASSPVGSPDLLLAKIPVGKAGITSDGPRFIAVTSDATVAYTPLEGEGRVAVIDLISLQQVNTNDGDIDPTIALPAGATPFSIVIGTLDKYAYVADRNPANGKGQIYVIDIDPRSVKYNKHIQTIQVGTNLTELSQMALSRDGKSLFITAPKATDNRGHIIAVNVDITTEGDVDSQWHQEVSNLVTNLGITGISAAPIIDINQPNRVQMVITNRQDDNYGFGVITIEDGNFATAKIDYKPLLLGSSGDYFDVNEAVAVTITSDGKYGFVAGKNSRNVGKLIPSVDADSRAGSNIGIIKDPLTSNAKLVAATLPIPDGRVNGLALSGDGKVLTAAYQGLGSGSIFAFDVEEIIKTIEHPELYVFEFVGENSPIFNDQTRPATIDDLQYVPIDRINPAIDKIGADLIREKVNGQVIFGVPIGSKNAPLVLGGNTYSVTAASDWLDLSPVSMTGYTEDLTPTFNWQFKDADNVQSVNLFVSTFDEGEGLLPWDKLVNLDDAALLPGLSRTQKEALVSKDWQGYRDYNPGRILTASWKRSTNDWTLADGTIIGNSLNDTTFTLPDKLKLTAGAKYHWAVQGIDNRGEEILEVAEFDTVSPLSSSPFSSVTVLTQGFTLTPTSTGIDNWVYTTGDAIIHSTGNTPEREGLLLRFEKETGTWIPVDNKGIVLSSFDIFSNKLKTSEPSYWTVLGQYIKTYYQHKPLVLLSEWSLNKESIIPDSGFSEGAADDLFGAMVRLDQALGGRVGNPNDSSKIYDEKTGNLIRTQGDLFNSPLHFIGHSRGAVVVSEIIQRLGTYFPNAGGTFSVDSQGVITGSPDRDLQMTTLDPHDFDQPGLGNFRDFKEPKIQIWDNVTYADNYYQTLGFENALTLTPNGRDLPNLPQTEWNKINAGITPQTAGLNFPRDAAGKSLGKPDLSFNMNSLTGFSGSPYNQNSSPHNQVVKWYARTVDLGLNNLTVNGRISDTNGSAIDLIYDRLGLPDLAKLIGDSVSNLVPWFKEEGAGQGWYYSVLGGGKKERKYTDVNRVPVSWDNTLQASSRGDFAVPTLFDGNFDASVDHTSVFRNGISNAIAGWSFRNNALGATWENNVVNNGDLVEWRNITSLSQNRIAVGYQRNSDGDFIDINGNPVVNLNIKSLKDALIGIGYSDVAGDNLKDPNNKRVTGLEFNLLLNDMQSVGYTIVNGSLLYLGQAVVGIDIDTLGDHLSTLQYSVNSDGNLVYRNNIIFLNKNKIITLQNKLKTPIKESYLQRLGINSDSQPNYALKLKGGDVATHNRFLVPAWGSLRFDLHVPDVENSNLPTALNNLKVFITSGSQEYELSSRVIIKNPTTDGQPGSGSRIGSRENGVEILFDDDPTNTGYADNRIGFGSAGFETFDLDIPDEFRGKVATIRFELEQDSPDVYLDNVFLQSQHLALGNPTNARIQFNPNLSETANDTSNNVNRENYLVEKPQYTVSYNDITKTANWASWQLNKSWLGAEPRTNLFEQDRTLPSIWQTVQGDGDINGNEDQYGEKYDGGHLTASGDRTRNEKDNYATFLMSNIVPQNIQNNRDIKWWRGTEQFSRDLVNSGKELYIIAGVYGQKSTLKNFPIDVPEHIWKVIVVMDKPGQTLADVNLSTMAFAIDLPNKNPANELVTDQNGNLVNPTSWRDYVISIGELEYRLEQDEEESGLHYDFLSNVSTFIQDIVENRNKTAILNWINANNPTAPLLADPAIQDSSTTSINLTVGHNGFVENNIDTSRNTQSLSSSQIGITQIGVGKITLEKVGIFEDGTFEIGTVEPSLSEVSIAEVGSFHETTVKHSFIQTNSSEISKAEIGFSEITPIKNGVSEVGFSVDPRFKDLIIPRTSKTPSGKISVSPSSVLSHQFFSVHDSIPQIITSLNHTATNLWSGLIQSPTPFNLTFNIADLPTGQLAEATITGYDTNGRPNSGTLTLDTDGNSLGWFIDTTPNDNSEFDQTITDTAFRATTGAAAGKYDLLTTILHELGHLNGIIRGNTAFDTYVQNINGVPTFINGGITATLTPDGSHLDSTLYPYDLMNTSLKPGVRKLPSALNLAMIDAINSGIGNAPIGAATLRESGVAGIITAPLTAGALLAINNGDFSTTADWNTVGATNIINGTATLTEQSQKLSELTQAFIIPTGAKTLQFTIKDNHLVTGDTTKTANDAFEVALLDTNTFNPLAGTSIGLNHTDSLLNIQANGTIFHSDKVTITALGNNSSIVTIDLTQVTPTTQATLYFNLLGFGARTSTVTIDDVKLFTDTQPIPVTNNDTLNTNQATPITFNPTTNDTNVNTIQIITQPTHGTLTQNLDGKLTYQPIPTYVGNDSFTYLGIGTDGQISNLATVNLTINNLPPTIETLIIPTKINEGQTIQLSATATDGGSSDNLTYTWDLGDNSQPIIGQKIAHQFLDNGTYNVVLTVTDFDGSSTQQSTQITVDNIAPTLVVDKSINTNINQGETITFGANYSDSGSNDSLNITWDFGDGSEPISFVNNPSHQFTKAGTYNVTVTITDNDGASTTDIIPVTINNLAPTINTIDIPTNIKEGETVQLTANATDAGNDTLTYNWYINSATTPIIGQTIDYNFTNSGIYPVKLEVIDSNGAITTQTVDATITNVAPTINQITIPTNIKEGDTIQLIATASDIGNDALTYNWYINNALTPITGATIDYTFTDNGIYPVKLEVIDTDGAVTTQTVDVTVKNVAPSIVNIVKPATIKEGESVTFSATATDPGILDTLTYSWNFGDNTNLAIGQNVNHTFADNGSYNVVVTVTDKDGASTTQAVEVTVDNVAPTIVSIAKPDIIKEGESVTFAATATDPGILDTLIYSWNFGDNTQLISGENVSHTFADNGSYNVVLTVTDKDGAVTTQTVAVTVDNTAPNIISITKPDTIKEGETITFSATAIDPGILDTLTYSWNFGDSTTPIVGQNVNHTFVDNGNYNVVLTVTDKDGGVTIETVAVKVDNVAPTIVSILKPDQINEGQLVEFKATATDTGINDTLTYNWNFGDGSSPVIGQNVSHTFADNGDYNVILTVTDKDGGVATQTVAVKVDNVAPAIVSIVKPDQINEGQSIEFKATATDPGILDTLTYSWNFGDNTNPVLGQNVNHTFVDNGDYNIVLTVTDKDGGEITQTVTVSVDNVAPTIVSIAKPNTIKEGESVTFAATATDPGILDTLTYSWNFGDNTTPVTGQNVTHTFADNGNYNVALTVTDKDSAVTTQTVTVTVDNVAPIIVNIVKPDLINEGESVEFKATATDAGINDTLTYTWNFGDNTTPVTGQNVNHIFVDNGNYSVVLTVTDKDGGVTTQTVVVKVDNVTPVIVNIVKPDLINEGESVEFKATATDAGINDTFTYNWNFGDNTTPVTGQNVTHIFANNGDYNVVLTVTDKDGGVTTQTTAVKVDNLAPTIVSIVKPTQINEGQAVTFAATATDPGILDTLTYSWNFGDTTTPVSGQNVNHTFADNGNYNVVLTVTDKDGASTTQTVEVTVDNVAPTVVSIAKPDIIKEGESVTFTATATDSGIFDTLTYRWNFGDNTNPVIGQNVNHTFADNGNYNVVLTVTDKDGGVTTQTVTVTVANVAATITNITLPQNLVAGTIAQFTTTATDVGTRDTLTYTWNFGDNTTATTGQNTTHTYTTAGTYTVILNVTDKDGATTTTTQNLTVTAPLSTGGNGIRAGGNIIINGSANFDGNTTNRTDDTKIYAGKGISLNGNITLPVKRDGCGNPLKVNGKIVLVDNQITLGTGANTSSNPNQYTNITTATQTITIPTYADIKLQSFTLPIGTVIPTFNIQTTPIRNSTDWNTKFPPAGTATNPTVVRIINGDLNLPANINLSNYILIVENGNINLSQGNPVVNNVKLIANNGNINLNSTTGTNLSLSASGNINITGNTKLGGNSLINSNGNITTNGGLSMINTAATVKMIAQGDLSVNGNTSLKGQLFSKKNVTINGKTTLVGSVDALLNVSIGGNTTILAK